MFSLSRTTSLFRSSALIRPNPILRVQTPTPSRTFFTIIDQYERGVTFTLGKLTSVKEPGIRLALPFFQIVRTVDMRTVVRDLSKQDVISRDNVTIAVDALAYFRIVDPEKAICEVEDYEQAICELAQIKLREILSHHEVNEILHKREHFNIEILQNVKPVAASWGIEVSRIQMKDISFESGMIRAMSKKAEAEREREATIIHADAQLLSASKLVEASEILARSPVALRLRELDAISQMAKEKNHQTIMIPSGLINTLNNISSMSSPPTTSNTATTSHVSV